MPPRNHQQMPRRNRPNVHEGQNLPIIMDNAGLRLPRRDLAKNAVHGCRLLAIGC